MRSARDELVWRNIGWRGIEGVRGGYGPARGGIVGVRTFQAADVYGLCTE